MSDKYPECPDCKLALRRQSHVEATPPAKAERVTYHYCIICGYQTHEVRTPCKLDSQTPKVRRR